MLLYIYVVDLDTDMYTKYTSQASDQQPIMKENGENFFDSDKWDAHCVMVAHNHPNGDHTPSDGDIETTRQLMAMSKDLGIPLLDHLVVTSVGYSSIRDYIKRDKARSSLNRV